jgi:hypothetical protein
MTINPFVNYAFASTDAPTERTMPDRLSDIHNVKDFGATGDGLNDDWAAIMAALNWAVSTNRGTIFFPPGTYYVSEPIDFSVVNIVVAFVGALGASTVLGSFPDYVFKRGGIATGNPSIVENLTVINNDPAGGGIRNGACNGGGVRNCTVTANRGISIADVDTGGEGGGSLDYTVENCTVSPGANTSGSIGIMHIANGPVLNCRIIGYEIGMILWGQEGSRYIAGCYFEGNQIAYKPGVDATGGAAFESGGNTLTGCYFKNNGTALHLISGGNARILGCRIEADEDVTVYGSIPQYGINLSGQSVFFGGVVVDGQYEQYAISIASDNVNSGASRSRFIGVNAFNTSTHSGLVWLPPTTPQTAEFCACNCPAPVYTMAGLPVQVRTYTINTATWSSGTATITVVGGPGDLYGGSIPVTISGVSLSGYNGTFTATRIDFQSFSYSVADPRGSGSGGTAIATLGSAGEGDSYNVSDSNSATWGAPAAGGGSTRAKLRWGAAGTNWTVVGV